VSALDEYRKACRIADEIMSEQYATTLTASTVPREYADMAIAELEAERDKVVSVLARALAAKLDQQNRAEQAEAELAEVQALRFDLQHKLDDARSALAQMKSYWGKTAAAKEKAKQRAIEAEAALAAARDEFCTDCEWLPKSMRARTEEGGE